MSGECSWEAEAEAEAEEAEVEVGVEGVEGVGVGPAPDTSLLCKPDQRRSTHHHSNRFGKVSRLDSTGARYCTVRLINSDTIPVILFHSSCRCRTE